MKLLPFNEFLVYDWLVGSVVVEAGDGGAPDALARDAPVGTAFENTLEMKALNNN